MRTSRRPLFALRGVGVALAAAALAPAGCETLGKMRTSTYNAMRSVLTSSYHDPDAETKMAKAEELYKAGDYKAAEVIFGDLADNTYNPVLLAEKARFLQAECLRERRHLADAVATYNRMLMDFPAGAYREQACSRMYEIAYKEWLEKDTLADIEAEQAGHRKPWWQRQRLPDPFDDTQPLFDTEGEALRALENAHTHDLTGPNADKALFWLGYVNFYRGRFEDADHFFSQLVEMHKDSKLRPAALEMAIIAKNNSTGGAVYDSQKASEALQLVHNAEATSPEYAKDPEKSAWLTRQKMAVRMQLAEKYFRTAEYYERTGHPASAYFYYELVCRQHPGTKYSDLAKVRLEELEKVRQKMEAEKAAGQSTGPLAAVRREWDRLTGKPVDDTMPPPDEPKPTGPKDAPPRNLPTDTGIPK